ncbi:MAG: type IV pilus modification protein PilV [Candidatus Contendobacter sp.]|nr:MAG: type IV pilus modification protein PilV [Candidatus Contendobacter sp.]
MNGQPRRFGQSGFSLLEVLITLLIVAIGLMGFAAMMLNSMKNNRTSMQRSMATSYAYDIIDCMRANRSAALDYDVEFGSALSGSSVAAADVTAWKTELATLLPAGDGRIDVNGNTVLVEIQWTETVNAGDDATHTWKTETTL